MKEHSNSRKLWIVVLILSLLLLAGGVVYFLLSHRWWDRIDPSEFHTSASESAHSTTVSRQSVTVASEQAVPSTTVPASTQEPLPDNPVDFAALREINEDVYAWIYIPLEPDRNNIDLPILRARQQDDDNFYLHKDIHRKYLYAGSIYTQKANAKDFSDRVTVIYGHNMLDGTMFSDLVYFQNQKFFEDHEFFYIYTPGHILTYRIAAAIQFDTRHLLNCFNFSDDRVYENWIQNYILNPKSMIRSVRENLEITVEDKLVVLSTCLEHGDSRYLIQGVLISDEPTN